MTNNSRLAMFLCATAVGFGQEAVVQKSTIWVDTVKRGDMTRAVRGLGMLARNNIAEVSIPAAQAHEIKIGQPADIDTGRGGLVKGKVTRVLPVAANEATKVEVQAERALPETRETLDVIVQLELLRDVLYVGRPAMNPAK